MEFLLRAGHRHYFIFAKDKNKNDHEKLRRKLVDQGPKQCETGESQAANLETQKQTKWIKNAPITSKHVFPKRSAEMTDGTEKPKIPSKIAKRAARYNEFGYNTFFKTQIFSKLRGFFKLGFFFKLRFFLKTKFFIVLNNAHVIYLLTTIAGSKKMKMMALMIKMVFICFMLHVPLDSNY